MERNRSACRWPALAARWNRLINLAPLVTSRTVRSNCASRSDCAMTAARSRLNSYSCTPRALSAPVKWPYGPHQLRPETSNVGNWRGHWCAASQVPRRAAGCQTVPARITARATIRIDASLLTTMGQNFATPRFRGQRDALVETPRSLCTCFLAVVQTNMPRWSHKRASNGRNVRERFEELLALP